MKNYLLALLACSLFAALPANAETKATAATVDELLKVMRMDQMFDAVLKQMDTVMDQAMQQALSGKNLPPEALEKSKALSTKLVATLKDELSPSKMKDLYVSIYTEVFTEDEIRAIIDFYKTPAGQALITKQPIVMQKSMGFMQQKMGALMPKIKAAVEESVNEAEVQSKGSIK